MEREVTEILGPVGLDDKTCRSVAESLREIEEETRGDVHRIVGHPIRDEEAPGLRWSKDVGLTAFLLKFGQGLGTFMPFRLLVFAAD